MKLSEWKNIIFEIWNTIPNKNRNNKLKTIFNNLSNDVFLKREVCRGSNFATDIIEACVDYANSPTEKRCSYLLCLLEDYYLKNSETCNIERSIFSLYKNKDLMPMFVLSYGRYEKNSTLDFLEKLDSKEIFDNTLVFVNEDQEEKYKLNHPKFDFYSVDAVSVGDRMLKVLQFCKRFKIKRAFIMEDDILVFNSVIKIGLYKSRCNRKDELLDSSFFKYIQYKGSELMDEDKNCSMIRIRNRFCVNSEQTSVYGHGSATIGGTPDLCWFLDVDRFYDIYKQISPKHYQPQYDWAMLCAMLKNRSTWYVLTGVCKHESMGDSVTNDDTNRDELANEIVNYYNVGDMVRVVKVKSTGGKIKLRCIRKSGKIVNY